jgi:hypothetical protein
MTPQLRQTNVRCEMHEIAVTMGNQRSVAKCMEGTGGFPGASAVEPFRSQHRRIRASVKRYKYLFNRLAVGA